MYNITEVNLINLCLRFFFFLKYLRHHLTLVLVMINCGLASVDSRPICMFKLYSIDMEAKAIILLTILGALCFSSYIIFRLISQRQQQLQPESVLRFKFLFFIHVFLIIAIFVLVKIKQFYNEMLCTFIIFLFTFIAIFVCQRLVYQRYPNPNGWDDDGHILNDKKLLPLEVTYTDMYYLLYMYSIMGITLSGVFIIVSQGLMCFENTTYNHNYTNQFLEEVEFHQALKEEQCAICLGEFILENKFVKIKNCGHVFHESCILQWIRYNSICPLDRRNISQ